MRKQSMPAAGDVIRLDGVTKTYQSRLSGGERSGWRSRGPW
jgi:hypothetical protein